MPGAMLSADTSFPQFTNETNAEKIEKIQSYLFMLLENLRYSFANLGRDNFNSAEFSSIADLITEPVYMQLSDAEGRLSTMLSVTEEGINARVSNIEGNVTTLTQTANGILTRVQDAEGKIGSLQLTAQVLQTQMGSVDDKIKSTITQTVNSISLGVSNYTGGSMIILYGDGIDVKSANINFTGMVTFENLLESGSTYINGDNIKTGTISAINISGCTISGSTFKTVLPQYGNNPSGQIMMYYGEYDITEYLAGGIRLDAHGAGSSDEATHRMFVYTNSVWRNGYGWVDFALKLESAGGTSITSAKNIYMRAASGMTVEVWGGLHFYTRDGEPVTINGHQILTA